MPDTSLSAVTTPLASRIMQRIHGVDVFEQFMPPFPEDLQGWNSQHPLLRQMIGALRPLVVIDVGVWKGGSTIFMAEILRQIGLDAAVVAVDTFLGSPEHWNRASPMFHLIPRAHGTPLLYEQFLSNVVSRGLQDVIVPLRQTSVVAAKILMQAGVEAGMVHIDASHDFESVLQDAQTYWELLCPGGIMIGDDYSEQWPGVVQAADQFAAERRLQLQIDSPKWMVIKPGPQSPIASG